MFRTRNEVQRLTLLLRKQPVVGAKPRSVLRVGTRVIGKSTETYISSDGSEIPSGGVDYVVHFL